MNTESHKDNPEYTSAIMTNVELKERHDDVETNERRTQEKAKDEGVSEPGITSN